MVRTSLAGGAVRLQVTSAQEFFKGHIARILLRPLFATG